MKFHLKGAFLTMALLFSTLLSTEALAQTSCCTKGATAKKTACCSSSSAANTQTSGCSPSSCRGAKTKFGEAKVITALRGNLIELKAEMEKTKKVSFDAKSYDIHGIVGDSDSESLQIIIKEVKVVEKAFAQKLNYKTPQFILPENKAKQVQYLNTRIDKLQGLL